jgi:hypothetical protein
VHNSDLIPNETEFGFIDAAEWEKVQREGDDSIKRWINSQLVNTSTTVVLIGAETSERDWVRYEIVESWNRGNAIVGVRIHGVKNMHGQTDMPGRNPLDEIKLPDGTPLSASCKTYDWCLEDGRTNLGVWIEYAYNAKQAQLDHGLAQKLSHAPDHQTAPSARSLPSIAPVPTLIREPAMPWSY